MIKRGKRDLKQGAVIWVPCEIKQGMFPTELYVTVDAEPVAVKGFIPKEDVKDEKVRAVIARVQSDTAALLFRGEIFPSTNPVPVSKKWLAEKGEIAP